jgi:hypothetical protein
MFVFNTLEVLALMTFVLSSGANVYGVDVAKHQTCLDVLSSQIAEINPRFLLFKPAEQAAQLRDLQSLFAQSDAAKWRQINFTMGWANMCQVEDVAGRVYRTWYPNLEIYVQAQNTQNAIHITEAQQTAMTSPFCIDPSGGSKDLQFVIGNGSDEVTRFENIVTDNGRNCFNLCINVFTARLRSDQVHSVQRTRTMFMRVRFP